MRGIQFPLDHFMDPFPRVGGGVDGSWWQEVSRSHMLHPSGHQLTQADESASQLGKASHGEVDELLGVDEL